MKRNLIKVFMFAMVLGFCCGCTPDETFVLVETSALNQAVLGGLASAQVEMEFDTSNLDDPSLPDKIKKVALPYLGEDAIIMIEKRNNRLRSESEGKDTSQKDGKMVARFSIPIGTEQVLKRASKSVLWLKYVPRDESFRLVPGNNLSRLNDALSPLDISVDYEGNNTIIKIIGDGKEQIGVASATVNGDWVIADSFTPGTGLNALEIHYSRITRNDHSLAPCFFWGEIPSFRSEEL